MSRFIETIKIQQRQIKNLPFHQWRLNNTFRTNFPTETAFDLSKVIQLPPSLDASTYKCRIVYDATAYTIEFTKYHIKPIKSLKLVTHNTIDYTFKFENRSLLADLYQQRQTCDDIIISKNGWLTDSYYCNIALLNQQEEWITPKHPLLKGTQRAQLILNKTLIPKDISTKHLKQFQRIRLFNALIEWEDAITLDLDVIQ